MYDADIAVIELAYVVQFTNLVQPICLVNDESEIVKITQGIVVGFGKTENGTTSDVANKLKIPIYNYHNCTHASADHAAYVSARTFCGGPADGRGVCEGDSGSGVYVKYNGSFYLRGIVSLSLVNDDSECDVNRPAVFTDVTKHYDWIIRIIEIRSTTVAPKITLFSSLAHLVSTIKYHE